MRVGTSPLAAPGFHAQRPLEGVFIAGRHMGHRDGRRHCQRHFVGDGLVGALHHERQRHGMGITGDAATI